MKRVKYPKQTVEYFEANGVNHYLLHNRSCDPAAPVLLIVHGGPGAPDSNAAHRFREWWKGLFHLVSWDQRGSGKTLSANAEPPAYPITVPDILSDMRAILRHLKDVYGAEKICLLGISWGTLLCSLYTLERPEDVGIYISAGQVTNFYRNEEVAYAKVREAAEASGNADETTALDSILPYPERPFVPGTESVDVKMPVLKRIQAKYGFLMKVDLKLISAYFTSPAAKFADFTYYSKKNVEKRKEYNEELTRFLFEFDILDHGTVYKVPVCYITGDRDYQTATPLAVGYFEQIDAPKKLHCPISGAGHNMMFDQPGEFARALADAAALVET